MSSTLAYHILPISTKMKVAQYLIRPTQRALYPDSNEHITYIPIHFEDNLNWTLKDYFEAYRKKVLEAFKGYTPSIEELNPTSRWFNKHIDPQADGLNELKEQASEQIAEMMIIHNIAFKMNKGRSLNSKEVLELVLKECGYPTDTEEIFLFRWLPIFDEFAGLMARKRTNVGLLYDRALALISYKEKYRLTEHIQDQFGKILERTPKQLISRLASLQTTSTAQSLPISTKDYSVSKLKVTDSLPIESYLNIVNLYISILEANRILDRFQPQLTTQKFNNSQDPITRLQPSNKLPNLFYKHEDETSIGAYKVRGAVVSMAQAMKTRGASSFITASTGNHALGVLKASEILKPISVKIVVPENTNVAKLKKIKSRIDYLNIIGIKATIVIAGKNFDEARNFAMSTTKGEYYIDPYSDHWVKAGQGTIGLEIFRQVAPVIENKSVKEIVIISPVGGGGLLTGIATAIKMAALRDPRFENINIKFIGLKLGDHNAKYGDAIRVKKTDPSNEAILKSFGTSFLDIDDTHMEFGMNGVIEDVGIYVEGAAGATLYPVYHIEDCKPSKERLVINILSGGNVSH